MCQKRPRSADAIFPLLPRHWRWPPFTAPIELCLQVSHPANVHVSSLGQNQSAPPTSTKARGSVLTLRASWRPSRTAFMKGSVAALRSALARLRAPSSSSRISGRMPFCLLAVTKQSPRGVFRTSSLGSSFTLQRQTRPALHTKLTSGSPWNSSRKVARVQPRDDRAHQVLPQCSANISPAMNQSCSVSLISHIPSKHSANKNKNEWLSHHQETSNSKRQSNCTACLGGTCRLSTRRREAPK